MTSPSRESGPRIATPTDRSARPVTARGLSLEWKIPLLMTATLAAGLVLLLAVAYATLTRRAEVVVRDRLAHAVREIAGSAESAMGGLGRAVRAVADDEAIHRALTESMRSAPVAAAARAALERLASRDSTTPVELWDANERLVMFVGRESSVGRASPDDRSIADSESIDSVRFGSLERVGTRARFSVIAPVIVAGHRIGAVRQWLYLGGATDVRRVLREITREDVAVYTRSNDDSLWVVAPNTIGTAPTRRDSTPFGVVLERPGVGKLIAAETQVGHTPWSMVLEVPMASVVNRPRATMLNLTIASVVIVAFGALLSWLVSRRFTRPLVALTEAAEAVAVGTYEHAIPVATSDELGFLTARFDAMARQVAAGRRELEHRVTESQSATEALEHSNWQLRETMREAERARAEAEHARADAEEANRAKSDFLAVMSHELRTPLNAIGGYAQILGMGLHGPVTPEQRDALQRIERSQAHLLTLINDVLNFARIDAGRLRYAVDVVPLHATLSELEALIAPQVRTSKLTFEYHAADTSFAAMADRDKVRQVVLNLIANAVKYTPEGGSIVVECEADERAVRIHVRDTGVGIAPDRLAQIFEPFVQGARALNRPNEGVGLGLAISRDLARGMKGELTVTSVVGRGSTFTLELPRSVAVQAPRYEMPDVARASATP